MKLGEALTLRAVQAQKLAELAQRVNANATSQEGEEPAEDPKLLLEQMEQLSKDHAALVLQINKTNISSGLGDLLVQREHLRRTRNMLSSAARAANSNSNWGRITRSEIKTVPHLDAGKLLARADDLGDQIRVVDAHIQEQNWLTDLVS